MTARIRSPQATQGAKLPGLQALRLQDPQAQKAVEGLREWVETRLGSRGDPYEKAVTLREFETRLKDVFRLAGVLKDFDGSMGTLRIDAVASLPAQVAAPTFVLLDSGDLYFGVPGKPLRKVTMV